MSHQILIKYWPGKGGRAMAPRLIFEQAGIKYQYQVITFPEFGELKKAGAFNFGQLPVMEVDGHQISQSAAIVRFAGKLAGLYPTDFVKAAMADEIIDAINDAIAPFLPTMRMPEEQKIAARKQLQDETVPHVLARFEKLLAARGPEYFVGELSVADFSFFGFHYFLTNGSLDHFDGKKLFESVPLLSALVQRIGELPAVKAYMSS